MVVGKNSQVPDESVIVCVELADELQFSHSSLMEVTEVASENAHVHIRGRVTGKVEVVAYG